MMVYDPEQSFKLKGWPTRQSKDPQIFDPSRFEDAPKPNTFMPFGNGGHACPGNELAKLQMLILIHHLVTNFR
ncbi:hypothetical protein Leryth_011559 [Lithospermum erythrorhizon]|nr:hypothetical protein Leryth_011559 [Lithospermum erythrorhizon]